MSFERSFWNMKGGGGLGMHIKNASSFTILDLEEFEYNIEI